MWVFALTGCADSAASDRSARQPQGVDDVVESGMAGEDSVDEATEPLTESETISEPETNAEPEPSAELAPDASS